MKQALVFKLEEKLSKTSNNKALKRFFGNIIYMKPFQSLLKSHCRNMNKTRLISIFCGTAITFQLLYMTMQETVWKFQSKLNFVCLVV